MPLPSKVPPLGFIPRMYSLFICRFTEYAKVIQVGKDIISKSIIEQRSGSGNTRSPDLRCRLSVLDSQPYEPGPGGAP